MIIKNGLVMNEEFQLVKCDLRIENGVIAEIGHNLSGEGVDAEGLYVLPGFIDTHIHGANGVRISDKNGDLSKITTFEATQGVTGLAITSGSSQYDSLLKQFQMAAEAAKTAPGAKCLGIHAEGPFLSKERKGAMNVDNLIEPSREKLDCMIEAAGGLLKLITIAPDTEEGRALISYAVSRGLTVSMGHTVSDYDTAMKGIEAGATRATHTFNAMKGLHHREPNLLGAALTEDAITCEMICDFVHLHPAIVKLIYRAKGADKICIISDSGHAAGMEIDCFEVDGIMRYVKDKVIRLADGTIAGSAMTMLDGVRHLVQTLEIPLEDVSKMVSLNPAKGLKMEDKTGSIGLGKCADLVLMDQQLNVVATYVDGICVFQNKER
ncbi:MAG: N-acetylglucosamine-6-phosphate deacetylase [Ruminococcaceae bacterium]|nr:N-acetylglucosamine-6-phosphate deacetylase [Oscillospiraceae bacterium]